jgi:predicted TIM-barrel fold metal-dependent hydrolase
VRRALFGSDLPFDVADPDSVVMARAAGHDEAAQVAVLYGNAELELRRVVVVGGPRG